VIKTFLSYIADICHITIQDTKTSINTDINERNNSYYQERKSFFAYPPPGRKKVRSP